jgi:hypothetical protein
MIPSKECVKHAARSERMEKAARDPEWRAIWSSMAKRWMQRAEMVRQKPSSDRSRASRNKICNGIALTPCRVRS